MGLAPLPSWLAYWPLLAFLSPVNNIEGDTETVSVRPKWKSSDSHTFLPILTKCIQLVYTIENFYNVYFHKNWQELLPSQSFFFSCFFSFSWSPIGLKVCLFFFNLFFQQYKYTNCNNSKYMQYSSHTAIPLISYLYLHVGIQQLLTFLEIYN